MRFTVDELFFLLGSAVKDYEKRLSTARQIHKRHVEIIAQYQQKDFFGEGRFTTAPPDFKREYLARLKALDKAIEQRIATNKGES